MARILGFHPRGPGSIPGVGDHIFFHDLNKFYILLKQIYSTVSKMAIYGTPLFVLFPYHEMSLFLVTKKKHEVEGAVSCS